MTSPSPSAAAAPAAATPPLLVPVGHLLGPFHNLGEHDVAVRVGPEVVRLDDDTFRVWALTHGTADRDQDRPWDRAAVLAAASGIADAPAILDRLIADRMVWEVQPGTPSAQEFAARHRLFPLMLGLGNTAEEPDVFAAGLPGYPIVQMSSGVYDLYQFAHLDPSLAAACEGAAASARSLGSTDPDRTDPGRLLTLLLTGVHALLTPNAVFFDTGRAA